MTAAGSVDGHSQIHRWLRGSEASSAFRKRARLRITNRAGGLEDRKPTTVQSETNRIELFHLAGGFFFGESQF